MIQSLSIRNIVSIKSADIEFGRGLNVLSGETGAGKSILLDSLGLALGWRAESGLARPHADVSSVTASFHFDENSNLTRLAAQHDIEIKGDLILRRQLAADGRSRAFVNDQAVSVSFLRSVGALCVEIEGQFASQGLLDGNNHREFLDAFADHHEDLHQLAIHHERYKEAARAYQEARASFEEAVAQREFWQASLSECQALQPREGEETELAQKRKQAMQQEKVRETLAAAVAAMEGDGRQGVMPAMNVLQKYMTELASQFGERFGKANERVESAMIELSDVAAQLASWQSSMESGEQSLEAIEERFFAVKGIARKHQVSGDQLPQLMASLEKKLQSVHAGEENLDQLAKTRDEAFAQFKHSVLQLRDQRSRAARQLDDAVMKELAPLKLEQGTFVTKIDQLPEDSWNEHGGDEIRFHVSMSKGLPLGALGKVASGGELSRLMLALRVAGASVRSPPSLIFDEVDSGIGGAVAAAVGTRLRMLSQNRQVIVVTHSPQVTAAAHHHFKVRKMEDAAIASTHISVLDQEQRTQEVARMLAGAEITQEATDAATRLLRSHE